MGELITFNTEEKCQSKLNEMKILDQNMFTFLIFRMLYNVNAVTFLSKEMQLHK